MSLDVETLLDYYGLEAELKKLEALATPSEAHGILCGQLSAGQRSEVSDWLGSYLANIGNKREPWEGSRNWFCQLYKCTLQELNDNQFNFMPLLPDDDDPLGNRLDSLAEWCSGFLAGFGTAGVRSPKEFNQETLGALQDIQQISQVDTVIDEELDNEVAYFEVVEYVRMAALLIFTEFALGNAHQPPSNVTLH